MEKKEFFDIKKQEKPRGFFKKFWNLVWKDDSFLGWIISLVFIFIIVKFIFFPLLFLITGTSLPLVVVESCSMYHQGTGTPLADFNSWWDANSGKYEEFGIDKETFASFTMKNGFNKGDIIFAVGRSTLQKGDIIIFSADQQHPIIHRIIKTSENSYEFSTLGDNNIRQHVFEESVAKEQVIGKAVAKIPYAGWIKLVFYDWKKSPNERGFC